MESDSVSFLGPEYLPLPPILINTSGIESYLNTLSRQLYVDMAGVKKRAQEAADCSLSASNDMQRIKRFMSAKVIKEMEERLANTPDVPTDAAEEYNKADADFEQLFSVDSGTPDIFQGMMLIARKLLADNERLRKAVSNNAKIAQQSQEMMARLEGQLAKLNSRVATYQRQFFELSLWLGTLDKDDPMVRVSTPAQGEGAASPSTRHTFEGKALRVPADADVDHIVSQSPLFLSLRRILLDDVASRLSYAQSLHSKDMDTAVSTLKEDVGERMTSVQERALLESRSGEYVSSAIEALKRRLRQVESHYVRQEDFALCLKSKVDVGQPHTDQAQMVSVEKRLLQRFADLEERMAFADVERREVRTVVRSLLPLLPHPDGDGVQRYGLDGALLEGGERNCWMVPHGQPQHPSHLVVNTPQHAGGNDVAPSARNHPTAQPWPTKSLQSVIGTERGVARQPAPRADGRSSPTFVVSSAGGEAAPLRDTQAVKSGSAHKQTSARMRGPDGSSRQLIQSLPPLPYERHEVKSSR